MRGTGQRKDGLTRRRLRAAWVAGVGGVFAVRSIGRRSAVRGCVPEEAERISERYPEPDRRTGHVNSHAGHELRSGIRQLFPMAFHRTWSELANTEKIPSNWYEFAATIREGATEDEYRA